MKEMRYEVSWRKNCARVDPLAMKVEERSVRPTCFVVLPSGDPSAMDGRMEEGRRARFGSSDGRKISPRVERRTGCGAIP